MTAKVRLYIKEPWTSHSKIPQCWMTGQAAGTAAGLAAGTGLTPRALDVRELREELRRQGAFLHEP